MALPSMLRHVVAAAVLSIAVSGVPWPIPAATPAPHEPRNVAALSGPEPTPVQRIDPRALDGVKSDVKGLASDIKGGVSSLFSSGLFHFPAGSDVEKSAGVSGTGLHAKPTQVLNIPAYGNWTNKGWNVRVHGNVYKVPDISQNKIDDFADGFLVGTKIDELQKSEQVQARNVTRSIFVVQQADVSVTLDFVNDVSVEPNMTGGAINAAGGGQTIVLPYNTTAEGDFDTFVTLRNTTGPKGGYMQRGNETSEIQSLNIYAKATNTGNATAYLVPPEGITVVSDIDDILRVTKIYEPKQGLLNTFARPFTPWMNMPQVYANWSSSIRNMHFHYLTTTPEQVTRNYMEFIYKTYPLGSFDTRPLNFSDVSATLHVRRYLLDMMFRTFPRRKFILVADTTNGDVMKDYPLMFKDYPGQVLCILLRNTSSTDAGNRFPYDTSGFKDIPKEHYMFFNVPDDLARLDVAHGQCLNSTIAQHVTFKKQGLPLGIGDEDNAAGRVGTSSVWAAAAALAVVIASTLA